MKSCVIRRRFHTSEASGTAVTVNLDPGFGVPKACLIMYTESSAATNVFDTTLEYRVLGIGMIGSTDSSVTSTLRYHCIYGTMRDNQSASDVRRQNSSTRFAFATDTAGATFWQGTSATFTTDTASFVFASSTPQTNGHLECIMTFFGGDDLQVGIGTHLMPGTAGGSNSYSALTFQPDIIIGASTITAINAGLTDDFRFCFGCASRPKNVQYGVYYHNEGGAGTMDLGACFSDNAIFRYSTSNAVGPYSMTMSGITTGGFTITSSDAAAGSNNLMIFMAIGTGNTFDFNLLNVGARNNLGFTFGGFNGGARYKNYIGASTAATTNNVINRTAFYADSIQLFGGLCYPFFLKTLTQAGTIQTNSAGTAVTGSGTFFHRAASGDSIVSIDNTLIGTISTVTSNTAITLTANAGATYPAGTEFGIVRYTPSNIINFGDQPSAADSVVFSAMHNFNSTLNQIAYSSGGTPGMGISTQYSFMTDRSWDVFSRVAAGNPQQGTAARRDSWWLAIAENENYNEGRRRKQLGD
jgi:hypothetical protein